MAESPALEAARSHCSKLSSDELRSLLASYAEGGGTIALQAWFGNEAPVPWGSAGPPPSPSRPAIPTATGCVTMDSMVTGCPWCRRPVSFIGGSDIIAPVAGGADTRCAYVTLLYGPKCHTYFFGALVLGWGLSHHGGAGIARVLMHTSDVPSSYILALGAAGWHCHQVEYLSSVANALFHNPWKSRFIDVFTKLRLLQLESFEKVLFLDLDMLVRPPIDGCNGLESLFDLPTPAAMKRGSPVPKHGVAVPYTSIWSHPTRREADKLPPHQQASGINAGTMLFRPDAKVFKQMEAEVRDWHFPEHYSTYMPEQEYLSRFFGTFEQWTHVHCRYNYEIDKRERIPHDWTEAHEAILGENAADSKMVGAVVLHYSGTGIKPWDLLLQKKGDIGSLRVSTVADIAPLFARLTAEGSDDRMEGYADTPRLWAAMLEWLAEFGEAACCLAAGGHDVISLVRDAVQAEAGSA